MKKRWNGFFLLLTQTCAALELSVHDKTPLNIESDNGISCHQETNVCQAQGHVVITQGLTTLQADKVKAHLTPKDQDRTSLTRVECQGSVLIKNGMKKLMASHGFYDLQGEHMTFFGQPASVHMDQGWVKARILHYNIRENHITASGDAVVHKDGYTMKASKLVAHLKRDAHNRLSIQHVTIQEGFEATSSSDFLTATTGHMDNTTKKAMAEGNIKLVRPNGVMMGHKAEADLNKGTGSIQGSKSSRVKVLLHIH